MNYKISEKKSSTSRLVFKRSRVLQFVLSTIIIIFGSFALPMGLLLFFGEDTGIHMPFLLTGIGFLFITAGIMMNIGVKIPEYIIFDNNTGQLKIIEKKKGEEHPVLSYSDINTFHKRIHKSGDSSSHMVEMEKKDGAFWTLYSSSTGKKAKRVLDSVLKGVDLNVQGLKPDFITTPPGFKVSEDIIASSIKWKRKFTLFRYILSGILISSFGMIIYGIGTDADNSIAHTVASLFIGAVSAAYLFFIIYNTGRVYTVEINDDKFKYSSRGLIKGRSGFTIRISEIEAVLFNFSLTMHEMAIFILKKGEKDLFQRIKRGSIGMKDIMSAIKLMMKIKKINVGDLSLIQKQWLENLLQKMIHEKSGRDGL